MTGSLWRGAVWVGDVWDVEVDEDDVVTFTTDALQVGLESYDLRTADGRALSVDVAGLHHPHARIWVVVALRW